MTKLLKIEGMMCMHCESHCKKALENIDGVVSATPNKDTKECVVELSKEVADTVLVAAVESAGYKVVEVK